MTISAELTQRIAFMAMTETDRELLRAFLPTLQEALPQILDQFYAQVRGFPEIAKLFTGGDHMKRAAGAQQQHWVRLFSGRFDEEYYASVKAIGLMHSRIGLDPRWYMGGYAFILGKLAELAGRKCGRRMNAAGRTANLIAAINKAVMLDSELAVSVYIEENKNSYDRKVGVMATRFEEKVTALVADLTTAANVMESSSLTMRDTVGDTNQRAMAVAAASEQASASIQSVSSSAEQLRASLSQIRQQADESAGSSRSAVESARKTDDIIRTLAKGADEIGAVIGLISQIANKTNMLALNASVEAARAGAAGKAFEVVAKEVKELANQTGRATDQIASQITQVQGATREAVDAIGHIAGAIDQLNTIANGISAAIREQDLATNDITQNVHQTAIAANEVSTNIVLVSGIADTAGEAAGRVLDSAQDVSAQAHSLSQELDNFLQDLRAA